MQSAEEQTAWPAQWALALGWSGYSRPDKTAHLCRCAFPEADESSVPESGRLGGSETIRNGQRGAVAAAEATDNASQLSPAHEACPGPVQHQMPAAHGASSAEEASMAAAQHPVSVGGEGQDSALHAAAPPPGSGLQERQHSADKAQLQTGAPSGDSQVPEVLSDSSSAEADSPPPAGESPALAAARQRPPVRSIAACLDKQLAAASNAAAGKPLAEPQVEALTQAVHSVSPAASPAKAGEQPAPVQQAAALEEVGQAEAHVQQAGAAEQLPGLSKQPGGDQQGDRALQQRSASVAPAPPAIGGERCFGGS